MNKWKTLGNEFEDMGGTLLVECQNMEEACEDDERFDELYGAFAALLETMTLMREAIGARFDRLDTGENYGKAWDEFPKERVSAT